MIRSGAGEGGKRPYSLFPLLEVGIDLLEVRESSLGFLGEDQITVQSDLEDAPAGGEQLEGGDFVLVLVEHLIRQTDGFRDVPSSGAVFHLNSHRSTPFTPSYSNFMPTLDVLYPIPAELSRRPISHRPVRDTGIIDSHSRLE